MSVCVFLKGVWNDPYNFNSDLNWSDTQKTLWSTSGNVHDSFSEFLRMGNVMQTFETTLWKKTHITTFHDVAMQPPFFSPFACQKQDTVSCVALCVCHEFRSRADGGECLLSLYLSKSHGKNEKVYNFPFTQHSE